VLQQPPLVKTPPMSGGPLPPPGTYHAAPFTDPSTQPTAPADEIPGGVRIVAIAGTLLGLALWLVRVFFDVARARKLWTGVFRIDAPLILVTLGLVIACVLAFFPRSDGAGLASGLILAALAFNTVNFEGRPRAFSTDRIVAAAFILATGLALFAAVSGASGQRAQRKRALLPAGIALVMLVLGQVVSTFGYTYFGPPCYVGIAIGLGLANRTGWLMVFGSLTYAITRGVFSFGVERGHTAARNTELLCGIGLAAVCLVFAFTPGRTTEHDR
jgi:hypothetical protein